jgi:3-hydroxy-3-methylglutaryl CoA synthase
LLTQPISSDENFYNCGIDSIGFYTPRNFVNLEALARIRNIPLNKLRFGLMTHEMRIAAQSEDIISLGVKAAKNALLRGQISPKEIDGVFVGTETITYAVKSVSNIYKDLLEIPKNCITQDIYNACAAGTLAIYNAIAQIEAGMIHKALVITVDISSYDLNSPGEPTQGAGAVAMIICRNPRIATFSKEFGRIASNVNDFYRNAKESIARVFGKYSIESYLHLQMAAYDDLVNKTGDFNADYYIFHAPYARLPLKFMQLLIEKRWLAKPAIIEKIKKNPHFSHVLFPYNPHFADLIDSDLVTDEIEEALSDSGRIDVSAAHNYQKIRDFIRTRCLPPLQIPSLFGNMYAAALWAQLMYVLETTAKPDDLIYFGSYGSGATALSGLLKIQPGFKNVARAPLGIIEYIPYKTEISIADYETLKLNPIFEQDYSSIIWAKVQGIMELPSCGFTINVCDKGCNLSQLDGLDHCPREHPGRRQLYLPLLGRIDELKPLIPGDLSPLCDGYVPVAKNLGLGQIVEFELRRWPNEGGEHTPNNGIHGDPNQGLLNWLPVYQASQNSPYLKYLNYTESLTSEAVEPTAVEPLDIKSSSAGF